MLAVGLVCVGVSLPQAPALADSAPAVPNDPTNPATVTADGLPTVQIEGVVWSQVIVGDTVYAGGSFTTARPAGAAAGVNTVTRNNLLAYNIQTGELISSFAPSLNGQVRTITVSPDKSRIYVGGDFTTVDGASAKRIAAFSTATGARVTGFLPAPNYNVWSLVATDSTVYAAGQFTAVGTATRSGLAAFSSTNGALLDWAPVPANGFPRTMVLSPDSSKVAVGGSFTTMNGSGNPGYGLAMLDTATGASLPFAANSLLRNGGANAAITTLTSDGTNLYGGGYVFGSGGTIEGNFSTSWADGSVRYVNNCHGDTYGVAPIKGVVYQVGHSHYCGIVGGFPQTTPTWTFYRATAFSTTPSSTAVRETYGGNYFNYAGQPTTAPLTWYPTLSAGTVTGQSQAAWTVTGNDDYVLLGGEFPKVNGVAQQGLVRFAVAAKAPNKRGPTLFNDTYPLNVYSTEAGKVRINWSTNKDIDNDYLTYRVYRDEQRGANLVKTVTQRATFWNPYTTGFTDTGLEPGSTHRYRVAVSDPLGNIANSNWVNVTVASSGADSPYVKAIYNSQPTDYWRFSETSGTTVADRVGFIGATAGTGVTRGTSGAIAGDTDPAASFNGSTNGSVSSNLQDSPPDVFSVEAWFKTSSLLGGKIIGFGDKPVGSNSGSYDRQVYLDSNGRVVFGVYDGNAQVISTSGSYRNGAWHHVVATLSPAGMRLYLDGQLAAQRTDVTRGQPGYWGYWRIGGDNLGSWPNKPFSNYLSGSIDEVAIYKRDLSAEEVSGHYAAGTGVVVPNTPPTATFSETVAGLKVSTDANASTDTDGTIASYAWDFGDGATATGVTATHDYLATGTYPVTLTVTDDQGGISSTTHQVSVVKPNAAPVAAFNAVVSALDVQVDASGSSDAEGPLASYAWDFGDGGTATGVTAAHSYTADGTYPVTLTVTDSGGLTSTKTLQVTVAAGGPPAGPVPFAVDEFTRSVTNGWGTADSGGTWTVSGTAANYQVDGAQATMRMAAAGAGPQTFLVGPSSNNTELRAEFGLDKAVNGGGVHINANVRRMANGDVYYSKAKYNADGTVQLLLGQIVGGVETVLQTKATGITVQPGDRLAVRVQAFGTAPTTLRAKLWKVGSTEPADWTASVSGTADSLQGAGTVGFKAYLSGSSTNAPILASFDHLWAGPTG